MIEVVLNRVNKKKTVISLLVILLGVPTINILNIFMPYSEKLWIENDLSFYSVFWFSVFAIQFSSFFLCLLLIRYNMFSFSEFGYSYRKKQTTIFIGILVSIFVLSLVTMEFLIKKQAILNCFVPQTPGMRIIYLICLINAGISEEFIFRSFCLGMMKKLKVPLLIGIIISSVAFTLIHGMSVANNYYIYFTFGVLMCLLYIWKKNILIPISIHILYNLFTVFYCFVP